MNTEIRNIQTEPCGATCQVFVDGVCMGGIRLVTTDPPEEFDFKLYTPFSSEVVLFDLEYDVRRGGPCLSPQQEVALKVSIRPFLAHLAIPGVDPRRKIAFCDDLPEGE